MEKQSDLYALILAGGSGTRLWPKSRKKTPKHLLKLNSDLSMIGETVERMSHLVPYEHIYVVTRQDQVADIIGDLPMLAKEHVIAEPASKNTAWAMGLGAYYIARENENAVVINSPADHVISDARSFEGALTAAAKAARLGDYLIALGIVPIFAHTGLGYIRIGEQKETIDSLPVYQVVSFVEKPDKATAEEFLKTNEYYWNANYYTWHIKSLKNALIKHAPHVAEGLEKIAAAIGTGDEQVILNQVYGVAEDTQIDKGISEKASNLLMIPGNFGWNDIGDWAVLYDIKAKDENKNVIMGGGQSIAINTHNILINSDKRLIAAVGVEDLVIIDTPNALLVCRKSDAQDVKKVVEQLKAARQEEYL